MDFKSIDLNDHDYIIYNCGYIERLFSKKDDIVLATQMLDANGNVEHPLMFFVRSVPITAQTLKLVVEKVQTDVDYVYDKLIELNAHRKIFLRGAICFKSSNSTGDEWDKDALETIKTYQHCACFNLPYKIDSFTTKTGKRVLIHHFDTESG